MEFVWDAIDWKPIAIAFWLPALALVPWAIESIPVCVAPVPIATPRSPLAVVLVPTAMALVPVAEPPPAEYCACADVDRPSEATTARPPITPDRFADDSRAE